MNLIPKRPKLRYFALSCLSALVLYLTIFRSGYEISAFESAEREVTTQENQDGQGVLAAGSPQKEIISPAVHDPILQTFVASDQNHALHGREILGYGLEILSEERVREDFLVRNVENDGVEVVAVERLWSWIPTQAKWVSGDVVVDAQTILVGGVSSDFFEVNEAELLRNGLVLERRLNHAAVFVVRLNGVSPGGVREAIEAIEQLLPADGFSYVEPDHMAYPAAVPNDPLWDSQLWHMRKIQGELAWDITEGDSRVVVAVADTGTRVTHEDLRNVVWRNPGEIPGNNLDDDGNGYVDDVYGWNVNDNNSDVSDVDGHGTHVGGTMAAEGNNGKGVAGVGWKHQLMVFACGDSLSSSETADAMDYMTMMKTEFGVNVVSSNWSWGSLYTNSSYSGSSTRKNAIRRARDVGILFVAAAGNDGKRLEGTADLDGDGTWYNHFPSSQTVSNYPNTGDWESVVSVAASTTSDGKAGFSNYGHGGPEYQVVDLAAPGAGIHSTTRSRDNSYGDKQGTSMASPHVAGAVGLVASANPSLPTRKVLEIVYNGLDPANTWLTRSEYQGRLNVYNSVVEANSYPHSQIINLVDNMVFPSGTTVEVLVDAWDTDGNITEVRLYENGSETPLATDSNGADGWSFTWSPSDGVYDLHVAATDNEGKVANPGEDQALANLRVKNIQVGAYTVIVESGEGANLSGFSPSTSYSDAYGVTTMQNWTLTSTESYTYEFQVPVSGNWDLAMWWPTNGSASDSVPFRVTDANGATELTINQSQNSGQFNDLGAFQFNVGTTYTAEIYYPGSNVSGRLFADALRLTLPFSSSEPLVSIAARDSEIEESGLGTELIFTRTSTSGPLTVNLAVSGSATADTDYTALPSTVSFSDGEAIVTLPLTPLDELSVESDETVIVEITTGAGYSVSPVGNAAMVTVTSDDLAGEFEFTVGSRSVSEGVGTFDLSVSRKNGASGAVEVDVSTSNVSATAGSDYEAFNQTLSWSHLDTSTQSITITVLEDVVYNEGNETFRVSLSNPTNGAGLLDRDTVNITINENDINAAPQITLDSPTSSQLGVPSSVGLLLETTASDDGNFSPLTYSWSQVSGPGTATFASPTSDDSAVEFDLDGTYVLRLSVDDGALESILEVRVVVGDGGGDPGYQENEGMVVIEAEIFDQSTLASGKEWVVNTDLSGYVGSGLVTVGPNTGTNTNTNYTGGGSARLDYQVNFATAGTYHIWIRGNSNSGGDDSVHASLNDQVIATADRITIGSGGNWNWSRNTMDSSSATLEVPSAGLHTFNLYMREDGASVDRIILTTDSSFNPGSGVGPDVSERAVRTGPAVNPGGPYSISAGLGLSLDATVTDDGFPEAPGAVTVQWSQISGPGDASFTDDTVEDATVSFDVPGTYILRLIADDGAQQTFADVDVSVTPLVAEPVAPTELSALSLSTTEIDLSWTDNSDNETGFKIQRSTTGGGSGYTTIGIAGVNATSYRDTGLLPSSTYFYRVVATNASGDSSPSNEASDMTSASMTDDFDQDWKDAVFMNHSSGSSGPHTEFSFKANGVHENGLLYAFQINSLDPADAFGKMPVMGMGEVLGEPHVQISFRRIAGGSGSPVEATGYTAGGVKYLVECVEDFSGSAWETGSNILEVVGEAIPNSDGTETVTVRLASAIDAETNPSAFLRVKVSEAP